MDVFLFLIAAIFAVLRTVAGQTLQCGQSGSPLLGQPFELSCTLTGQITTAILLNKEANPFMQIPIFYFNINATFYDTAVSSRLSAVVSVNPGVSRTVTLKFSTLECIDSGVYDWVFSILNIQTITLQEQQTIAVKGACQSLTCDQSGVATLGQPFELYCTLTGQATAYYGVLLKKADVGFMQIPMFDANNNATFVGSAVSPRLSALVSVTPGISRNVTVKFSTLECNDNGVYDWGISVFTNETVPLTKEQSINIKVIPQFGSNDGYNITFFPTTNLMEGDLVTFSCHGDVGNTPVCNLAWFYYLNGSTTAVDVSTKATAQSPQDSTVAGRTFSKTRVSTLTLTLTKDMDLFVVRCTVNQDQPFNAVGQGYKMTQPINIMYNPTVSSLTRVPETNQYTEGDALLTLTCTATSNPAPEYFWTYESVYTNRTQIGTGNQLVLRNLTLSSKGVYTCVAYNLIKGIIQTTYASTEIYVVERTTPTPTAERPTSTSQVLGITTPTPTTEGPISTSQVYKPLIISLTRDPNYDVYFEGLEILTLTCVASGNPLPSFMWIFQSGYEHQEQVGRGYQLILRRLTIQHTGIYTCMAYNTINGNNQSTYSSVLVHVENTTQTLFQSKRNDAIVIGATFGVTAAVLAIILAILFVFIGRRYRCVIRQERDTQRNVRDAPAIVECDEYQNTPYNSSP